MKRIVISSVALFAVSGAVAQTPPAAASTSPSSMARPMQDKVMTRPEVVQMVRDHFGKMDADRNGAITTAEVEQMRAKFAGEMKEHRFEHRLDEPGRDPNAAFDRLDGNKDGTISREEFTKAREERIERRVEFREKVADGAPKDGKQVRHFARRHHGPGMLGGRMIVMADSNKDGQITLAEAETMALQHFDQMDSNKDGRVTREERRAGRHIIIKQMREEKESGS